MPKRLAIARVSHEGNSFSPVLTGLRAFERREWVAGEAAPPDGPEWKSRDYIKDAIDREPDW